jgi:hypothetical protein
MKKVDNLGGRGIYRYFEKEPNGFFIAANDEEAKKHSKAKYLYRITKTHDVVLRDKRKHV